MNLAQAQKKLANVTCPACNNGSKLEAVLRCDLDQEACVLVARCGSCQATHQLRETQGKIDFEEGRTRLPAAAA